MITGNYISIKDGILWRGNYHGQMKNALIKNADYIYILSPLGKIFSETAENINNIIGPSQKKYKNLLDTEATVIEETPNISQISQFLPENLIMDKQVKLVTTTRHQLENDTIYPGNMLRYFTEIDTQLKNKFEINDLACSEFSPHIDSEQVIYECQMYHDNKREAFLNYEFPHTEIRNHMRKTLFPHRG
ncbi:MAG: hypothetical protein HY934_06120 [Candidatus Firestonebacteria bacterium]|nr:hypothetical protein [Candidatus Firestonebacteria bacterium]